MNKLSQTERTHSGASEADTGADTMPCISFEHPFFQWFTDPLPVFQMGTDRVNPVMVIYVESEMYELPFIGLKQELNLQTDDPDDRMLSKVSASLRYVAKLEMYEPLPPEISMSSQTWIVNARHYETAEGRIMCNVIDAHEETHTLPKKISAIGALSTDAQVQKKFIAACHAIADKRSISGGGDTVLEIFSSAVDSVACIDLIRSTLLRVEYITLTLKKITPRHRQNLRCLDLIKSINMLMKKCLKGIREHILISDDNVREIVNYVDEIDVFIAKEQQLFQELFSEILLWTSIFECWENEETFDNVEDLLTRTYQFLQERHHSQQKWQPKSDDIVASKRIWR